MKIALVGTDGIPARYGGFETFVEQVVPHLIALGHEVLVVGSSVGRHDAAPATPGLRVVNLPLRANGASSVLFDVLSVLRSARWADATVLLGVSAGLFVPVFRLVTKRGRLVVNVDGLESRRAKWSGLKGRFLAWSEAMAVRFAARVVADNDGIAELLRQRYGQGSTVIAYGADHVLKPKPEEAARRIREAFGLEAETYALTIARIEPENHIGLMIDAFLKSDQSRYVLVGNFQQSAYGRELQARHAEEPRISLVDATYDPLLLASLRSRCRVYLHGHSVGGTNPSLVEMLPYARPILAWDCRFNRSTLRESGAYFGNPCALTAALDGGAFEALVPPASVRQDPAYRWRAIAERYCQLIRSIAP